MSYLAPPSPSLGNGPFPSQNRTLYFRGGSFRQRSIRKMYLHAMTSEVQPGLCLPACFRKKLSVAINHLEMPVPSCAAWKRLASYGNVLGCSLCASGTCNENTAIYLDLSENKSVLSVHFVLQCHRYFRKHNL